MIPLNDTEPNRYTKFPTVTILLIVVNVLVFIGELVLLDQEKVMLYGSVPYFVINRLGGGALASVTSTFLHAGWMHLFSNMSALWVFGRRVEDACGSGRFLVYYMTCGVTADIFSTLVRTQSMIPSIGASGAIFGLMGAYLLLYPYSRIRTMITLGFSLAFPKLRAYWIVFYFLLLQIVPALTTLFGDSEYSVNHWAHLGGFFSAAFIFLFLRPEAFARYWSDTPV